MMIQVNIYRTGKGNSKADRAPRSLCIPHAAETQAGRMIAAGAGSLRAIKCEVCERRRGLTILQAQRDAGDFREYIARRFGAVLTHGGDGRQMHRGERFCRQLARMTGQTFETVLKDVRADYEVIYGD